MAKKKSAIEKAIESLESEKAVIDMAIARLRQQQKDAPKRKAKLPERRPDTIS